MDIQEVLNCITIMCKWMELQEIRFTNLQPKLSNLQLHDVVVSLVLYGGICGILSSYVWHSWARYIISYAMLRCWEHCLMHMFCFAKECVMVGYVFGYHVCCSVVLIHVHNGCFSLGLSLSYVTFSPVKKIELLTPPAIQFMHLHVVLIHRLAIFLEAFMLHMLPFWQLCARDKLAY